MYRNLSALRVRSHSDDPRNWDDARFADRNDPGASGNMEAVKRAVEAGLGVSVLSRNVKGSDWLQSSQVSEAAA